MMMMAMMAAACCCMILSGFMVMQNSDSLGLYTDTVDTVDTGVEEEGGQENCYVTAQEACKGKRGKDRGYCIGSSKKKCMEAGGVWDPTSGKQTINEKRYTIVQDWDDQEVDVPGSASRDTNENCVYFYDSYDWTETGRTPANRGEWCVDRDGSMSKPLAIWHLKNKTGDRREGMNFNDIMDFMRVGKNVKVTVWDSFSGGKPKSTPYVFYGDDTNAGKLRGLQGPGRNKVTGFQVEKI